MQACQQGDIIAAETGSDLKPLPACEHPCNIFVIIQPWLNYSKLFIVSGVSVLPCPAIKAVAGIAITAYLSCIPPYRGHLMKKT